MADDQDRALLDDLLARAKRAGADGADAVYIRAQSQSVSERLGAPEAVERSEESDLGLRVFVARRQAGVATSDISPAALDTACARARGHGPRGAGRSLRAAGDRRRDLPRARHTRNVRRR